MIGLASTDHPGVVVVAWDDESLDRGLAGLGPSGASPRAVIAGIVVDVGGFRRLTSRTLEVLLGVGRRYGGRLAVQRASPAQARVLSKAGIAVAFDPIRPDRLHRYPDGVGRRKSAP